MASSSPPTGTELAVPPPSLIYLLLFTVTHLQIVNSLADYICPSELSQNVQLAMDNMLKMISEIDQNSAAIKEDMEKSKDSVLQRKIDLEEKKDHFQKAAYTVLDMLISRDIN
ncbi:hypothetical protein ACS0TY_012351 [Phlomoides rotata]